MNHLLIGGTNDGKRVSIPDGRTHFQMKCESGIEYGKPSTPFVVKTEIYERRFLRGSSREFEVFAIQGMTGDELMVQLISGYKK